MEKKNSGQRDKRGRDPPNKINRPMTTIPSAHECLGYVLAAAAALYVASVEWRLYRAALPRGAEPLHALVPAEATPAPPAGTPAAGRVAAPGARKCHDG